MGHRDFEKLGDGDQIEVFQAQMAYTSQEELIKSFEESNLKASSNKQILLKSEKKIASTNFALSFLSLV